MDKKTEEIIDRTINRTILKLKMTGMMKDGNKTAAQKTEDLLKNYYNLKLSDQPYAKKIVKKIDEAMETIKEDAYFDCVKMFYLDGCSREEVAEHFGTTLTTISRNKTRLINSLKVILFSEDYISELFL